MATYNEGNNHREKFKTKKTRREMFARLVAHLASGLSIQSFPELRYESIQRYMDTYPKECPRDEYDRAIREGQRFHERVGQAGMTGRIRGFSPSTWRFNMMNRYGWKHNSTETPNETPQQLIIRVAGPTEKIEVPDKT